VIIPHGLSYFQKRAIQALRYGMGQTTIDSLAERENLKYLTYILGMVYSLRMASAKPSEYEDALSGRFAEKIKGVESNGFI